METSTPARELWELTEPIHITVYFSSGVAAAMEGVGLQGGWMGYVAGRTAPLGAVPPDVVTALFHGFSQRLIERALPDAWSLATPAAVLAARADALGTELHDLLDDHRDTAAAVLPLLRRVVDTAEVAGRPMFGAWRAQPRPDDVLLGLWHETALLREHRGDGHVAAMTAAGLGPVAGLLTKCLADGLDPDWLCERRGWEPAEVAEARAHMGHRGLLDDDGLTTAGAAVRAKVEETTDALAVSPAAVLDDDEQGRLLDGLRDLAVVVADAEAVPFPNPVGVPRPS